MNKQESQQYSILYSYSTSHLKGSNKVRFFYAFKGRQEKPGILEQTKSDFVTKGLIAVKPAFEKQLDAFFRSWNCSVEKYRLAVPTRLKLSDSLRKIPGLDDVREIDGRYVAVISDRQAIPEVRKLLENVILKTSRELLRNPKLLKSFSKGQSLLSETPITHTLFFYSTNALAPTDKVRFFYALKGRGGAQGALQVTSSKLLAKTVILTPIDRATAMQEFLQNWGTLTRKLEVKLEP